MLCEENLNKIIKHTINNSGHLEHVGQNIRDIEFLVEKHTNYFKSKEINARELENDLVNLILQIG